MKRATAIILLIMFILCGCSLGNGYVQNVETPKEPTTGGVWFSYLELSSFFKSEKGFREEIKTAAENCGTINIKDVYIHIRPFCDSLFQSEYFPQRTEAAGLDFDPFQYIIEEFHKQSIKVHAWINPYRVSTTSSDVNSLDPKSPAYIWLNDSETENDKNVCFYNGIYLNPAEAQVQRLVIDGVRETVAKYDVDGIHFDDYFYPTVDAAFDEQSYNAYCSAAGKPLSLADWRRANVNALINGCKTAIESKSKDIVFSLSPAASIEKNYNELFADVEYWVENGLVDLVIPQLYFGFEYPDPEYRFESLLKDWKKLMKKNSRVGLHLGLASYKAEPDLDADREEWQNNTDIIARQVRICEDDDRITGWVLYSYSYVFGGSKYNQKQLAALKEYIEK